MANLTVEQLIKELKKQDPKALVCSFDEYLDQTYSIDRVYTNETKYVNSHGNEQPKTRVVIIGD